MAAEDAARDSAEAIVALGAAYMLAGSTYAKGAELGFSGLDFYVLGRGGVLGDVDPDVVAAAFVYWNPDHVRAQWEIGTKVMAPLEAARAWAEVCHTYAESELPEIEGLDRLGDLAGRVVEAAPLANAALFAGWRRLGTPGPDRPRARVLHLVNALRELRGAQHAGAVLAAGLVPTEALAYRAPGMAPVFGWDPASLPDGASVEARWQEAEVGTNRAMGRVLGVLDDGEQAELVELVNALHDGWQAAQAAQAG